MWGWEPGLGNAAAWCGASRILSPVPTLCTDDGRTAAPRKCQLPLFAVTQVLHLPENRAAMRPASHHRRVATLVHVTRARRPRTRVWPTHGHLSRFFEAYTWLARPLLRLCCTGGKPAAKTNRAPWRGYPRRRTVDALGWPGASPAQPSQLAEGVSPFPPGFERARGSTIFRRKAVMRAVTRQPLWPGHQWKPPARPLRAGGLPFPVVVFRRGVSGGCLRVRWLGGRPTGHAERASATHPARRRVHQPSMRRLSAARRGRAGASCTAGRWSRATP